MSRLTKIMKIELTEKQYKTLLVLTYCGEWMLNSFKTNTDKVSKETDNLEQVVFSYAKNAGLENWIEYDEKLKMYLPTANMEEELQECIDKYNQRQKEI